MRIREVFDATESLFERIIYPTIVNEIEAVFNQYEILSDKFSISANVVLPEDTIYEVKERLNLILITIEPFLNSMIETVASIIKLLDWLEPY